MNRDFLEHELQRYGETYFMETIWLDKMYGVEEFAVRRMSSTLLPWHEICWSGMSLPLSETAQSPNVNADSSQESIDMTRVQMSMVFYHSDPPIIMVIIKRSSDLERRTRSNMGSSFRLSI